VFEILTVDYRAQHERRINMVGAIREKLPRIVSMDAGVTH
jgi:hypothetical protein